MAHAATAEPDAVLRSVDPDVLEIADSFVVIVRASNRAKARYLAAASRDVEWSAQLILRQLSHGPMRASEVAESLHSDPSTVSRQVATLVRDGLVERRADPADGRASMLVLTPKADGVLAAQVARRSAQFADLLADWDPDERAEFARSLRRFAQDFETAAARFGEASDRPVKQHQHNQHN